MTVNVTSPAAIAVTATADNAYAVSMSTPSTQSITIATPNKGDKGDKGDIGSAGPAGTTGPAGPKGDKGDTGAQGPTGPKGDTGAQGLQGLQGIQGPKGDIGLTGPAGQDGAPGIQGIQGIQGPQGVKGDQGDIGPKGDKGDTGNTGAAGPGVPTGGATGEVLRKTSATDYATEWGSVTPAAHATTHAIGGSDVLTPSAIGARAIPTRARFKTIEEDFVTANANVFDSMLGAAISSGTLAAVTSTGNHPGVVYLRDSTTANGGYRVMTDASAFLINGGERAEFVFQARGVRAAASWRLGFHDSTAINTAPTDGAWLEGIADGTNITIRGRCKNNAGPAETSTYQLTINTWYTGVIEVNAAATRVTFSLFSESGTSLWSQYVESNIPKVSGRETGFGAIAGETTADAAADIIRLDYMRLEIDRTLTR